MLIVPIGIGGTQLAPWAPGGELHVRVEKTARMLANVGIRPTHVLWHQGESDVVADTPPAEYVAQFGALVASLAALGIDAPVFPAVATHCYFEDELRVTYLASTERIRRAQTSLPERIPNVWTGPTPNASSARGSTSTTKRARTRRWADGRRARPIAKARRCGEDDPARRHPTGATTPAIVAGSTRGPSLRLPIGNQSRREGGGYIQTGLEGEHPASSGTPRALETIGIHLKIALGLSNEVGPPQYVASLLTHPLILAP